MFYLNLCNDFSKAYLPLRRVKKGKGLPGQKHDNRIERPFPITS